MEKLLHGKTIIVIGAAGLLGVNLVDSLLRQSAKVIAADINSDFLKTRLETLDVKFDPENLVLKSLDITDEVAVKNFFKTIEPIDGTVNATYPRNKQYGRPFFDVTKDSFNENLSLHLGSAFVFMQSCAEYFLKHKTPFSLVNISSIYGVVAPKFEIYENTNMTTPVEYAAIKSALIHLNKYVAAYVRDSRFRINSVSPGGIFDNQPDDFLLGYKSHTHGAGMLDVSEVIGAILFLLSNESRYVTGQNIVVDDGFIL